MEASAYKITNSSQPLGTTNRTRDTSSTYSKTTSRQTNTNARSSSSSSRRRQNSSGGVTAPEEDTVVFANFLTRNSGIEPYAHKIPATCTASRAGVRASEVKHIKPKQKDYYNDTWYSLLSGSGKL